MLVVALAALVLLEDVQLAVGGARLLGVRCGGIERLAGSGEHGAADGTDDGE